MAQKGLFCHEDDDNNNQLKSIVSYMCGAEALGNNSADKMFA
jgi:hypothetical protein